MHFFQDTSKAPSRDEEVGKTPTAESVGEPVEGEEVTTKPSVEFQETVVFVGDEEEEFEEEVDLEQAWQVGYKFWYYCYIWLCFVRLCLYSHN